MKQLPLTEGTIPAMKQQLTSWLLGATLLLTATGCAEKEPEQVADVQVVKNNAIEVVASTARLSDGRFVVHLHKNIYHNAQLIGVDTLRDTLPDLGMETVTMDDADGDPSVQTVPVQYNILFKVDSLKN